MKRHFIFTSGRSGSNYVTNTLNLCPDCVNYGEVLGDWTIPYKFIGRLLCNEMGPDRYLDYVYSSKAFFKAAQIYSAYAHLKARRAINYKSIKNVSSVGIKDFLVTLERRRGLEYLRINSDIKIIYLYRTNILKKYISGSFLKANRIAKTYSELNIEPINIDLNELIRELNILVDESKREKEFVGQLKNHEVLSLEYEEYFKSPKSIAHWNKSIFEFLNITPIVATSRQKKILPESLKDTVRNSSEVVELLKGTQFEPFIY